MLIGPIKVIIKLLLQIEPAAIPEDVPQLQAQTWNERVKRLKLIKSPSMEVAQGLSLSRQRARKLKLMYRKGQNHLPSQESQNCINLKLNNKFYWKSEDHPRAVTMLRRRLQRGSRWRAARAEADPGGRSKLLSALSRRGSKHWLPNPIKLMLPNVLKNNQRLN